ncbi:hypothetical protein [Nisaea nitritireducens]|uniref:hypothetical protein n=1 Tax=Nisaea nitritireducens TaxID=568392 RepID=UPI001868C841|nr:hypothetical protein [Nisaea nitritireducens]
MSQDKGPHLSKPEVRQLVTTLDEANGDTRRAAMARLSWRPAWAIRSRNGALSAFFDLFRRRKDARD